MLDNITQFPVAERRAKRRFALNLEVSYWLSNRRPSEIQHGRIVDISSSGLRFIAERPIDPGQTLDVAIAWPVLLNGRIRLRLIVVGAAVWSRGLETALEIQRYEFRTRPMAPVGMDATSAPGRQGYGLEPGAIASVPFHDGSSGKCFAPR